MPDAPIRVEVENPTTGESMKLCVKPGSLSQRLMQVAIADLRVRETYATWLDGGAQPEFDRWEAACTAHEEAVAAVRAHPEYRRGT